MDPRFEKQEREIDRQLAGLAERLDPPAPRPECLASIKANIDEQARRMRRRAMWVAAWRPWLGAAAALLLMVGLSLPPASKSTTKVHSWESPEAVFAGWVDALGESETRFALLLEDSMYIEGAGFYSESDGDIVDPFESLEESLESFEYMVGA